MYVHVVRRCTPRLLQRRRRHDDDYQSDRPRGSGSLFRPENVAIVEARSGRTRRDRLSAFFPPVLPSIYLSFSCSSSTLSRARFSSRPSFDYLFSLIVCLFVRTQTRVIHAIIYASIILRYLCVKLNKR